MTKNHSTLESSGTFGTPEGHSRDMSRDIRDTPYRGGVPDVPLAARQLKTCTQCKVDRPVERFPCSKLMPDGRIDCCLGCIQEISRRDRQRRAARMAARGHFHIRKPRSALSMENA